MAQASVTMTNVQFYLNPEGIEGGPYQVFNVSSGQTANFVLKSIPEQNPFRCLWEAGMELDGDPDDLVVRLVWKGGSGQEHQSDNIKLKLKGFPFGLFGRFGGRNRFDLTNDYQRLHERYRIEVIKEELGAMLLPEFQKVTTLVSTQDSHMHLRKELTGLTSTVGGRMQETATKVEQMDRRHDEAMKALDKKITEVASEVRSVAEIVPHKDALQGLQALHRTQTEQGAKLDQVAGFVEELSRKQDAQARTLQETLEALVVSNRQLGDRVTKDLGSALKPVQDKFEAWQTSHSDRAAKHEKELGQLAKELRQHRLDNQASLKEALKEMATEFKEVEESLRDSIRSQTNDTLESAQKDKDRLRDQMMQDIASVRARIEQFQEQQKSSEASLAERTEKLEKETRNLETAWNRLQEEDLKTLQDQSRSRNEAHEKRTDELQKELLQLVDQIRKEQRDLVERMHEESSQNLRQSKFTEEMEMLQQEVHQDQKALKDDLMLKIEEDTKTLQHHIKVVKDKLDDLRHVKQDVRELDEAIQVLQDQARNRV